MFFHVAKVSLGGPLWTWPPTVKLLSHGLIGHSRWSPEWSVPCQIPDSDSHRALTAGSALLSPDLS